MQDHYDQIRFMAANYSRLQGLRALPPGVLAVFVAVWTLYHHGPTTHLSEPVLVALGTALLYWLIDRYYRATFGEVKQTPRQRKWEFISSAGAGVLAILAFLFDMTKILSISTLGLLLSASLLDYVARANIAEWRKTLSLFPENVIASLMTAILSLLPLFGISWWLLLGIKSQIVGIFMIFGIVIILTGILGHVRMLHSLSIVKVKSNANTL